MGLLQMQILNGTLKGTVGTVCNTNFTKLEAAVICNTLGYDVVRETDVGYNTNTDYVIFHDR